MTRFLLPWTLAGAALYPALVGGISLATGHGISAPEFIALAGYGAAITSIARLVL